MPISFLGKMVKISEANFRSSMLIKRLFVSINFNYFDHIHIRWTLSSYVQLSMAQCIFHLVLAHI